jgi:hypothetical protein
VAIEKLRGNIPKFAADAVTLKAVLKEKIEKSSWVGIVASQSSLLDGSLSLLIEQSCMDAAKDMALEIKEGTWQGRSVKAIIVLVTTPYVRLLRAHSEFSMVGKA